MRPSEIRALRELLAAATQGPLVHSDPHPDIPDHSHHRVGASEGVHATAIAMTAADARLFVALVNAAPALLDALEKATAESERLGYALEADAAEAIGKTSEEAYRLGRFKGAWLVRDFYAHRAEDARRDAQAEAASTDSIRERAEQESRAEVLAEVEGWLDIGVAELLVEADDAQ